MSLAKSTLFVITCFIASLASASSVLASGSRPSPSDCPSQTWRVSISPSALRQNPDFYDEYMNELMDLSNGDKYNAPDNSRMYDTSIFHIKFGISREDFIKDAVILIPHPCNPDKAERKKDQVAAIARLARTNGVAIQCIARPHALQIWFDRASTCAPQVPAPRISASN